MARNNKTPIDKLDDAIDAALQAYAEDISQGLEEATIAVGKAGVKALKAESKSKLGGTGGYAKSWRSKVETSRVGSTVILYSGKPGLPHLLEHGHANRGGGRTPGHEHIAPIENELNEKFTKMVKEAVT